MDKKLQDLAWASMSKEMRSWLKNKYLTILNKSSWQCSAYLRGRLRMMRDIYGEHNLISDAEPEEILTVERKRVQSLHDASHKNKREDPSIRSQEFYNGALAMLEILFGDKCLPDKEDPNSPKHSNPFQIGKDEIDSKKKSHVPSDEAKDEAKELDLCKLLKGCEGEKVFSTFEGDMEIYKVTDSNIAVHGHNTDLHCGKGFYPSGICHLYPSRALYEKYPLDAYSAWMEWKEARKPKRWRAEKCEKYWRLDSAFQSIKTLERNDSSDEKLYECGNYFRTEEEAQQAAEGVREYLLKFHEKNCKQ